MLRLSQGLAVPYRRLRLYTTPMWLNRRRPAESNREISLRRELSNS